MSIFSVQYLKQKTIVIGVPSVYLQDQFIEQILRVFPNRERIYYVGGNNRKKKELGIKSFLEIKSPLERKRILENATETEPVFVVSTYDSCIYLLDDVFDYKIGDEAHHLVGLKNEGIYRQFHKIKSNKSFFMTATIKITEDEEAYSMDNELDFGKCIDIKNTSWAIENKKITDYSLMIIGHTDEEIQNLISKYKPTCEIRLFIAAYSTVTALLTNPNITHALIYTNEISHATQIIEMCIKIFHKLIEDYKRCNEEEHMLLSPYWRERIEITIEYLRKYIYMNSLYSDKTEYDETG